MNRLLPRLLLSLLCLAGFGGASAPVSAQDAAPPVWLSTIIWAPSLPEAGTSLAEHVNQIDAACTVQIDNVQSANGSGPEGAVYAFLVTWSCPESNPNPTGATWQSTIVWQPTLADAATSLTQHLNQIDASCRVEIDPIQSTNGAGPEGPVYAFVVAWAC